MAFTTSNALRTTAPVGHRHSPARSLRHVTLRKPCSPMGWCPQHGSSRHSSQWQQQQPRLQAAAVAEAAQLGGQLAEGVGVLGIGAAGLFVALWNTEKSAKAGVEQDLQQTKVGEQLPLSSHPGTACAAHCLMLSKLSAAALCGQI
eukprot:GHRQ01035269.1.p1 GENE.GHRQ01035269.1~~GHRQ01035269.1.p1  ORF type:complete len:146 (+),score=28.41 GHRQ01035269.1:411-848(+)